MQPTSLTQAVKFAAKRYPGESREQLVERVNMVRSVMWNSPEKRELVFRREDQEQVQQFRDFSSWGYRRFFTGITLPVNVTVAEYVAINGRRVPIDGEVKENLPPGFNGSHHRPTAARLAVKVPLKNDLPLNNRGPVCFWCKNAADNGLKAGVEYQVANGDIIREDVEISTSGPETSQVPVRFLSVTLPDRQGWIRIATADGYDLGNYHPSVISPQHIRVHVNGACCGQLIHWIGLREPMAVIFDSDQVEMADEFAWINAFTWVELHLKTTKTREELQTYQAVAAFDSASAASHLKAEQGAPGINLRPRESRTMWRRVRDMSRRGIGPGYGSGFNRL